MSEHIPNKVDDLLCEAKAELDDVLECGNPASITLAVALGKLIEAVEWLNENGRH